YGKYNFRNLDFSDAKRCGVSTHYSEVTVKNCQFERNEYYGLQSYYNKSFEIEDSRINENGSYGLLLYHGKYYGLVDEKWDWYPTTTIATIRNTPIENSKSYGLYIENCTEDSVSVVNSPIRGNGSAGLYAVRSKFEFSPRTLGDKWQLSDNGSHIYAAWGTYVFKDLNLTGAPSYGAATWGSDVTVSNCSFSGNGSYGFQSHYNNPCLIENSQFDNNRWAGITFRNEYTDGQGVQHAGPIEMRNCSISGNHVGIYLPNSRTDMNPIKIVNTPIRDNTGWGVYFNSSQVALNPSSYPMSWQLEGNANNFLIYHGETRIDNVKITASKGWGAYVVYSDAVVKNSSFSGNGNGLYLHANAQSVVENCDFDDNASWGLWVRPYYGYDSTNSDGTVKRIEYTGPVTLTNISSQRNGYAGLGMYDYTVDRDLVELKNVTLADNKGPGIHFYYL
ncbi:MAG: right-handed parallel beta-helix repeat-containing protein, partial [Planctomycetales bacterium]|nr:right-handed parallel beta-helix repeat-containing protein [Planctomycetales bacterium]